MNKGKESIQSVQKNILQSITYEIDFRSTKFMWWAKGSTEAASLAFLTYPSSG